MEAYDIPAADICVTEETIKKSRFITYLAHTEGSEAAKPSSGRSVSSILMPDITAGHGSLVHPTIHNNWGSPMMANHRGLPENRCWLSSWAAGSVR